MEISGRHDLWSVEFRQHATYAKDATRDYNLKLDVEAWKLVPLSMTMSISMNRMSLRRTVSACQGN